ncbi:MAG: HPr family phosphocarrier protein [Gammaproteobacteria bacterium]|nr:HPr family phosphocarrier protein [Gammaproteobacteria bacterium]NIR82887.1 HPr family phosphocarrier protein [Gammaproteobacteria bacterium]NIR89999.1 HPr family phosphocarrier protein [Gammaproteobacteria bacterium]NIU03479.1 HPr family phosphocarrier protein [Gammaproteobacteria bacterium]NIV50998.1 HPr family phosphocarrier protein [Gammaproteobacteria bacterium]
MREIELTIVNKLGLHARAAAKFVTLASGFESDIKLERNGRQVNGKSIMGVMMLAAGQGSSIRITASGVDEEKAIREIEALVSDGFGENHG